MHRVFMCERKQWTNVLKCMRERGREREGEEGNDADGKKGEKAS